MPDAFSATATNGARTGLAAASPATVTTRTVTAMDPMDMDVDTMNMGTVMGMDMDTMDMATVTAMVTVTATVTPARMGTATKRAGTATASNVC